MGAKWTDIITIFDFPPPIRKAIYTTNAKSANLPPNLSTVNRVIRVPFLLSVRLYRGAAICALLGF